MSFEDEVRIVSLEFDSTTNPDGSQAFRAGAKWAKEWIEKERKRQRLQRKAERYVLSDNRFTMEDD